MFYQFIQIVGLSCISSVMHLSMSHVYWHICQVVPVRARAAVSMIPCGYWTLRVYRKGCSLTSVFDWLTGCDSVWLRTQDDWQNEWAFFFSLGKLGFSWPNLPWVWGFWGTDSPWSFFYYCELRLLCATSFLSCSSAHIARRHQHINTFWRRSSSHAFCKPLLQSRIGPHRGPHQLSPYILILSQCFPIISQCSKTVCRNHFSLIHLFPASSKSGPRLWWLDANCACFIQTELLLQSRGLFPHLSQTKPYNRRNTDPPLVTTQATKPAKHGVWHTSFLSPANSHAHAHCCQLRTPADTSLSNASTTSCVNFPESR